MPGFNINGLNVDGGPSNTVETSRRNRFVIRLMQPLTQDIVIYAHKADRPSPEIDSIVMHHGQDEINLAGKNRWNPININFYEVHDANSVDITAKQLYEWWSKQVIDIANSVVLSTYKKTARMAMLDGKNKSVWEYTMYGVWPKKISPDSLDYTEHSISEIVATLAMDKCVETPGDAGRAIQNVPSCPVIL